MLVLRKGATFVTKCCELNATPPFDLRGCCVVVVVAEPGMAGS